MRTELIEEVAVAIFNKQYNSQVLFDALNIEEKIETIKHLETTFKNMFDLYKPEYELFYNDIMSFFHDYRNKMAYIDYINKYVNNVFIEYNGSAY